MEFPEADIGDFDDITACITDEDANFYGTIDCLTNIVCSIDFQDMVDNFLDSNCSVFDESSSENKLIYHDLFKKFGTMIESSISHGFKENNSPLPFNEFLAELEKRPGELEDDVFECLLSMSDFSSFKEMMITAKNTKVLDQDLDIRATHLQ